MTHHGDDYAHRGERDRRRRRMGRIGLIVGAIGAAGILARAPQPPAAQAAPVEGQPIWRPAGEVLTRKPKTAPPAGVSRSAGLKRRHQIFAFAARYHISNDLSAAIYDAAIAERLEPELAFRVVNVESQFKETARSPVGAVGLTQLMPSTARHFRPGITREQLYDRETNLRIGFRYLRGLIRQYRGNVRLALLAYNRGPVAVENELAMGLDPTNGYERAVMKGYRGRGILE